MNNNQTNSTQKMPLEQPSTNILIAMKELWAALTKTNDNFNRIITENKELKLKVNEFEKLWKVYNELKTNLAEKEDKALLYDSLQIEFQKVKSDNIKLADKIKEHEELDKSLTLSQKEFISKNKALHYNSVVIKSQRDLIAEYENRISDLENKIIEIDKNDRTEELSQEVIDLKSQMTEIQKNKDEEILLQLINIEDLENIVKQKEEIIAELNKIVVENKKISSELSKSNSSINELQDSMKVKSDELRRNVEEIQKLNELRQNDIDKIKELKVEYTDVLDEYRIVEDEKNELYNNNINLLKYKEEASTYLERLSGMEKANIELIGKKEDIETELNELKMKISFFEEKNTELNRVLQIKDNDIKLLVEFRDRYRVIEEENKLMLAGIAELKQNINIYIDTKEKIEDDLENLKKYLSKIEMERDEYQNVITILEDEKRQKDELILKIKLEKERKVNLNINDEEKAIMLEQIDEYMKKLEKIIESN